MPNEPNEPNGRLGEADWAFVEQVAQVLIPWGVAQTTARMYGYLLLVAEPVSLQQITADLGVSKSSASVAGRQLEMYTLARRRGERGTRRIFYEVSDNYEGTLTGQTRMLQALAELFRTHARRAAPGPARERLVEIADFCQVMFEATETAVRRWRERTRG